MEDNIWWSNFSTWVQCLSPGNPRAGRNGEVFQYPGAFSVLVGARSPRPQATREVHLESLGAYLRTLASTQWVSWTCFHAKRKEACRRQQSKTQDTHFLARLGPGLSTLVACVIFLPPVPRSPGEEEESSICLLPLLLHLHWKAKAPCSQLKGKARLTFLTLQQMLTACPAFHNANPYTSHLRSVRNTENICQNSPTHAESEKSSYYCKLYIHYLSNELSAVGIQFISTLALSCSFISVGDERNHL